MRAASRHTEFPDEEGTEIRVGGAVDCLRSRHTEFPDEEGTEILTKL